MKYLSLFILVLILCAVMAVGSVLPGVTAHEDDGMERIADLNRENTLRPSRYSVSGSRQGQVTVKDATTGEIIRTFQMDSGVVVRETFLLEGGKTVAASQKDHAVFWDLETGKEVRRFPQRIYGFSHDETKFFTWKLSQENYYILLYSYPDMSLSCKMLGSPAGGPDKFKFSPNDRFLDVSFHSRVPLSDEDYINPPIYVSSLRLTNIFNLQKCEVIEEFSKLRYGGLAEFSSDSKFYILNDPIWVDGRRISPPCNFNLSTYQLENCTNTIQQPSPNKQRFVQ